MLETGHLTADQLAWYVTDGLDTGAPVDRDRLDQLDAHIAACERCARRLTDEARLELALTEVAARPSSPRSRAVAGGLLAAAALLLIWLGGAAARDSRPPPPAEPAAAVPIDAGVQLAVDSDVLLRPDNN